MNIKGNQANMKLKKLLPILIFGFLSTACSGTFTHSLKYNPNESLRVAVLPFVQVDENDNIVMDSGEILIDGVPLVSDDVEDTPPGFLRKLVQAELAKTHLHLIPPFLIDAELPHHGFSDEEGNVNYEKLYKTSPVLICKHFLGCDAIAYGKVTKWERSYYGIQSTNTIGLELKIVSSRDGSILFEAYGEDYDSRGFTKGPTGLSSIILEPIKALDSEIINDLARDIVKKMLKPLRVGYVSDENKSELPSIYASSHDNMNGMHNKNDVLVVVIYGTKGQSASFSLGTAIEGIPMEELHPGHYFGEYIPLPTDSFSNQNVIVELTDQYGRSTFQTVSKNPITLK